MFVNMGKSIKHHN